MTGAEFAQKLWSGIVPDGSIDLLHVAREFDAAVATLTAERDAARADAEALRKAAEDLIAAFSGFDKPMFPVSGELLRNLILAVKGKKHDPNARVFRCSPKVEK